MTVISKDHLLLLQLCFAVSERNKLKLLSDHMKGRDREPVELE